MLTYEEAQRIKALYPVGTRIKLIRMDDAYNPIPAGSTGTIFHVDDAGQMHIKWDNRRSSLAVIPYVDEFEVLED